jgi:hypothetical protein
VNTLWLRDKLPSGPDGVSTDTWFEQLPARLGDCFDLPARLVSALGTYDEPHGSRRADFRRALIDQAKKETPNLVVRMVLRSLHDRLGPVWGGNDNAFFASEGALVHRLLKSLSLIEGNDQFKIDGPALLAGLEKNLAALLTAERDSAKWTSDNVATNPWIERLAARMSAISDLPAAPGDFLNRLKEATVISSDPAKAGDPFDAARLAAVVSAAMRPEVLTDLLVDSWHATNLAPAENDALARLETLGLRTAIAKTIVAARVRRALLQPAWTDADGLFKRPATDENDLVLLRGNAVRSFAAYGLATLTEGGDAGVESAYAVRFLRTALLSAARRQSLKNALDAEATASLGDLSRSVSAATVGSAAAAASHSPGGITIQLDRVVRGPSNGGSGDDDFNQNLSGYAILARRKVPDGRLRGKMKRLANQPEAWRGLSIVNLGLDENKFDTLNEVGPTRRRKTKRSRLAPKPIETVVALTPGYDGALPTAAITYDNAPLVGKAVIVRRADTAPPSGDQADNQTPLVVPLQPMPGYAGNPSQAARLPFLAFGLDVEIAAFAVTNHGAIPKDLAYDDFPALLVDNRDNLKDSPYIRKISYRRRVAVGPLASEDLLKPDPTRWNGFSVDPTTRLLSDELRDTGLPSTVAFDPNQPTQRPMPRALLLADSTVRPSQNKNTTTFKVRAPSVDVEVFDRWIAYDEFVASDADRTKIRNYRKQIRNTFDAAATELQKVPFKNTYSLGDPAVSALVVRATRVFNGGASDGYKEEKYVDWTLPLTNYPADTHRTPLDVNLQINANPPATRLSVNPVALQIAAGEVWKVELYAGIDPQLATARFAPALFQDREVWQSPNDRKQFYLVSPFTFALEGGSTDMPSAQQIYDWFKPGVLSNGDITFAWDREKTLPAAAVGAVNIGWQQWRSTGRPASPYPYSAADNLDTLPPDPVPDPLANPLSYPLLWEIEAFADRPDEPSQGRRFEPKLLPKSSPAPLGSEQPTPSGPARYFRFQISAESRYARLYNPILPPVLGSLKSAFAAWSTNWKRLFRAAMPTAVPALSVRAVVPLTRSVDRRSLGGTLVVVDGAVGETGGLAEAVEIRAIQIVRQLQPSFDYKSATEFGADPILRVRGRADADAGKAVSLRLTGPIGHTFDFDARAPAFASSSYVVAAPDFAQADPTAGWMAKLRARRILDPRAVAGSSNSIPIPPTSRKRRLADGAPDPLPLSGDGDLSLTFTDLQLQPGQTITIALTADRPGDAVATLGSQLVPTLQNIILTTHGADGSHNEPWTTIDFGAVVAEASAPSAIRLLVTRRRIQRAGMPIDHFEATLEAIDSAGAIVRAGEIAFEDDRATGAVRLGIASSAAVTLNWLRAPLASDWSETGWTQFLTDAIVPMRNSAGDDVALTLDLNADEIRVTADIKADWLTFMTLTDRASDKNQGLIHFLLLTRNIPSSTGSQNDEAYVALYVLEKSATDTTADFVRFGLDGDPTPISSAAELQGRILTVQADPRVWRNSREIKKSKKSLTTWLRGVTTAWGMFFKPEDPTLGRELAEPSARGALLAPSDTDLRIVTMYAPFGPINPVS